LPMRSLTIEHGTALALDASGNANQALDWLGVNFTGCATVGRIANYGNVIWTDCALLNSANLTIDGTNGTVGMFQTIFSGIAGQTTVIIPSTATFTRRMRIIYSAFVTPATGTGINFSTSATVPDESYILNTVNFGGGGTALAGVDHTSNKALFINCIGIINSGAVCQYYMSNNATATTIAATGTFYKVAGTTTGSSANQKFNTATSNRATYTGAFSATFRVVVTAAVTSGNNQTLRCRIGKNGTTIPDSETEFKTSSAGESSNFTVQTLAELATNDYLEVFVANDTSATNATFKHLNVIITRIN